MQEIIVIFDSGKVSKFQGELIEDKSILDTLGLDKEKYLVIKSKETNKEFIIKKEQVQGLEIVK